MNLKKRLLLIKKKKLLKAVAEEKKKMPNKNKNTIIKNNTMSNITAADVAKLRKSTGAGMMDCKKALQEADGNFEKAIEIISKKGQAVANKRADREAGEGVVLSKSSADNKYGAIMALNCETDFVAKNEDFVKLAYQFLDIAIERCLLHLKI